jgi:hypothetical protein
VAHTCHPNYARKYTEKVCNPGQPVQKARPYLINNAKSLVAWLKCLPSKHEVSSPEFNPKYHKKKKKKTRNMESLE